MDAVMYFLLIAIDIIGGFVLYRLNRSQKKLLELADIFTSYMQVDFQEEIDEQFETIVEYYDEQE